MLYISAHTKTADNYFSQKDTGWGDGGTKTVLSTIIEPAYIQR